MVEHIERYSDGKEAVMFEYGGFEEYRRSEPQRIKPYLGVWDLS